jgi:enamine deaminase RidA (YjgF/YER057c/UK114 family)
MSKIISHRSTELGLRLPAPPIPRGEYVSVIVHGGIAYVSGQVSRAELAVITGPASSETPSSIATAAAHAWVLRALSALENGKRF